METRPEPIVVVASPPSSVCPSTPQAPDMSPLPSPPPAPSKITVLVLQRLYQRSSSDAAMPPSTTNGGACSSRATQWRPLRSSSARQRRRQVFGASMVSWRGRRCPCPRAPVTSKAELLPTGVVAGLVVLAHVAGSHVAAMVFIGGEDTGVPIHMYASLWPRSPSSSGAADIDSGEKRSRRPRQG